MPVQQMKNLSHPENWKLKANYPYPTVQIDGCPSKQYDRVVSYWFRRGSEQFDKLGKVIGIFNHRLISYVTYAMNFKLLFQALSYINSYNLAKVEATQRLPAGNIRSAAQVGVFPSPDSNQNFEAKIQGGEKGFIQQFPWIASLHARKAHQCTGSLFSNQWILTAGHCRKASEYPRKVSRHFLKYI